MRDPNPGLQALFAEVVRTRSVQREQQRLKGARPEALNNARWATLRALEAYVEALEERSWPVPRKIHQDLELHRALCGHRGGTPGLYGAEQPPG